MVGNCGKKDGANRVDDTQETPMMALAGGWVVLRSAASCVLLLLD